MLTDEQRKEASKFISKYLELTTLLSEKMIQGEGRSLGHGIDDDLLHELTNAAELAAGLLAGKV